MSQYQNYLYSQASIEQDFFICQTPFVCEERLDEFRFLMDNRFYKELVPTEDYPEVTEMPDRIDNQAPIEQDTPVLANRRAKRFIQTTQGQKQIRREISKGLKNDTTELNINLKTILHNKLKELSQTRQLDRKYTEIVKAYNQEIASFRAMKKLAKSSRIKDKSLKFIKSPAFAIKIFQSNSNFANKLTLIKYIESVRKNFEKEQVVKWKEMALE